jgi:hypothetical protein
VCVCVVLGGGRESDVDFEGVRVSATQDPSFFGCRTDESRFWLCSGDRSIWKVRIMHLVWFRFLGVHQESRPIITMRVRQTPKGSSDSKFRFFTYLLEQVCMLSSLGEGERCLM